MSHPDERPTPIRSAQRWAADAVTSLGARPPAVLLLILGAVLLLSAIAETWVGVKAEHVSDLVRPEMTDEGLAQHRKDFETARQAVRGLSNDVLPAIAQAAGTTAERLRAQIDVGYPAVAKLLAQENQIVPFAEASLVNLERQQANFENADSAPTSWLSAYAGGVLNIALGMVLLAVGFALLRGRGSSPTTLVAIAAAVAVVLIVLPLALGIPGKAVDAETVLGSLNPSPAVVQRTEDSMRIAHEADTEFRTKLAPDLAAALGTTPIGLQLAIARQSPATAAALVELPAVLDRYDARLAIRVGGAEDLRFIKRLPVAALGWFGPVFGLALGIVTAWAWRARSVGVVE